MKQFKPSLEKVMKDLEGFSHEIIMYVYHKLNGRDEEAQTYLDTYQEEQQQMKEELAVMTEEEINEFNKQQNEEQKQKAEIEDMKLEFNNIEV